ncbi:unnamed protein product [Rhodiola kirilowii]
MDSVLNFSAITLPIASPHRYRQQHFRKASAFSVTGRKCNAISPNGCASAAGGLSSAGDAHNQRSSLESLFCYDKSIPEEVIEKPVGLSLADREIGDKPRCSSCEAKGAVLCLTCTGSGLYVDSILESQGIIVKVRCLGCGGTGNIMCSECGGRGHV